MSRLFLVLITSLFICLGSCCNGELTVNLICPANGKGLEVDGQILQETLTAFGCTVNWIKACEAHTPLPADINIFCEQLCPHHVLYGRLNWFIPNPECYYQSMDLLDGVDLILCRTKEVQRIFDELGKRTFFTGFTTPDAKIARIRKDFNAYIHVGGSSLHKGTHTTAGAWQNNPHFPLLRVISTMSPKKGLGINILWYKERLQKNDLRVLQNHCGIHLCVSETEGFGHYLMEAMSCGSVVITADAPPMNEYITDKRFCVPSSGKYPLCLADVYLVDSQEIERRVEEVLTMPLSELAAAGTANRRAYLAADRRFRANLRSLIDAAAIQLSEMTAN